MQKISKLLTTFIDHRQKGESLWLKKFEKTSVIKFKKKEFGGSLKLNLESLFLKIEKHWYDKRGSLIYWERVTSSVSEMHLLVLIETQQFFQKISQNISKSLVFHRLKGVFYPALGFYTLNL